MGGVVVTVSQGPYSRRAYLHFVSSVQVNGILPSDTPLGDVQITVGYNGATGPPATITVVDPLSASSARRAGPAPELCKTTTPPWISP